MNVTKLMWAYLLYFGDCGEPSEFGGVNPTKYGDTNEKQLKIIKQLGVNWLLTTQPQSDRCPQFEGTENESSYKEYLIGTLVLKNGKTQNWASDCLLEDFVKVLPKLLEIVDTDPVFVE